MEIKEQDEWRETGYRDFANQAGNCGAIETNGLSTPKYGLQKSASLGKVLPG
ncbi:rCG51148 [Rattus norvegicus]|uniref:RCG51148 n=1 Tax=Rattus norvegicus TaxID=10116 RepID=A6IZE3_RAT|nr:rCG51148 [Rattus norvegicus]